MIKHGQNRGHCPTPEYSSWQNMLTRCRNSRNPKYASYGGRGISVCERWSKFEHFFADMGHRPTKDHTIDRVDNDGDYEPANCRWATAGEQARNRRSSRLVEYQGQEMCLKDACTMAGQKYRTVWKRINSGFPVAAALSAERYQLRDKARACRGAK